MQPLIQKPNKKEYKKAFKKHAAQVRKELKRIHSLDLDETERREQIESFRQESVKADYFLCKQFNMPLAPYQQEFEKKYLVQE